MILSLTGFESRQAVYRGKVMAAFSGRPARIRAQTRYPRTSF